MQLYADDVAALILMLAFGGVLAWVAVRHRESVAPRLLALAFAAVFLFAFVPGTLRSVQAKHALSRLVPVPEMEQIHGGGAGPGPRTFRVYTALPPESVRAFYADAGRTRGWQRQEGPDGLTLTRPAERLEIRAERGSWDGTRGALGLTRVTYRWQHGATP